MNFDISSIRFSRNVSRPDGLRLTFLLLLVVLAPSLCLLWFMNQAVQNERLAFRQKLNDAFRAHLTVVQQQLESGLKQSAQDLDAQFASLPPARLFERLVSSNLADAVLCYDSSNRLLYPNVAGPLKPDAPTLEWSLARDLEQTAPDEAAVAFARIAATQSDRDLAASALQAQARCLVRAGRREAALAALTGALAQPQFQTARDFQGRLIVPNALLMALELCADTNSNQAASLLRDLKSCVADYSNTNLSAAQRRFLMHELVRLAPRPPPLPMLPAEDLAAQFLESAPPASLQPGFHSTTLPDVWRFDSTNGRVITLHRTASLLTRLAKACSAPPISPDTKILFLAPGEDSSKARVSQNSVSGDEAPNTLLSLPAGASLPGWHIALGAKGSGTFALTSAPRVSTYIWVGVLMVAAVAALGLLALSLLQRQLALTRLRNDLVANVTHELKTPLASMRLLVDTLLDSAKLDETTARDYLQLIARENNRLSRLIDNFLAFSRMERNKRAFDFTDVPAAKIASDAASAVRERFDVAGCSLTVAAPPNLPLVTADPDALVTALVNLLDNAFKYTGDDKKILLTAVAENGHVSFSVRDNGVGITPRETRRIFKRFYQVDQHPVRAAGGCGLGLSIVKFIVAAHHGNVTVQSVPGSGSTFTITLPMRHPLP